MKQVKVIQLTFFTGRRLKPGAVIYVPDDMKRKWFIDVEKKGPAPTKAEETKKTDDDISDLI